MKFQSVSSFFVFCASYSIVPQVNLIQGGGHISTPIKTNTKVEEALKQLAIDTKNKPLIVPFLGADATAIATKPAVRKKIQFAITKRNPRILTVAVVKNIFFQNTPLSPGIVIKLQAYYSSSEWQGSLLFYLKENSQQTQAVCDALKKINKQEPLHIDYLKADATALASKAVVTAKLRLVLQKRSKIFSQKITSSIKFSDTPLIPGNTVAVTATYQSQAVVIYVAEATDSHTLKETATQIAAKITGELYLKNFCWHHSADEVSVANNIQAVLANYEVLSVSEAAYVSPEHHVLANQRTNLKLRVVKDNQVAYSKSITLIIEDHSKITTWSVDDYKLHFIVYFTAKDYQYMRSILLKQTGKHFLGAFAQILNDNSFDHSATHTYSLPSLTGRSLFKWSNKLEYHMGHFGAWTQSKAETIDNCVDINSERIYDWPRTKIRPACGHIYHLFNMLKSVVNNNPLEFNQHGLSVNLKWTFGKGSRKYTFETGHFW